MFIKSGLLFLILKVEREWLVQSQSVGFVPKARLEYKVLWFVTWCLKHYIKLVYREFFIKDATFFVHNENTGGDVCQLLLIKSMIFPWLPLRMLAGNFLLLKVETDFQSVCCWFCNWFLSIWNNKKSHSVFTNSKVILRLLQFI